MSRRPAQPVCPKGRLLGHAVAFPALGRTRSTAASAGASPCESGHGFITGGHTSSESGSPAGYTQSTSAPALLLLDQRRFGPPRPVEVDHDGLVAADPAGLEAVRRRPRMAGRRRVRRRVRVGPGEAHAVSHPGCGFQTAPTRAPSCHSEPVSWWVVIGVLVAAEAFLRLRLRPQCLIPAGRRAAASRKASHRPVNDSATHPAEQRSAIRWPPRPAGRPSEPRCDRWKAQLASV